MRGARWPSLLLVGALATGCRGKLLAKAELHGEGTAEARFEKGAKGVVLWGNLDGKWRGGKNSKLPVAWDVEVFQKGKPVGRVQCDTDHRGGVSICGGHRNFFGEHAADCEVDLACKLPALEPGEVVLRVKGRKLHPERVVSIEEMSLFVREE